MDYLKTDEVAVKWGISPRRLQTLCAKGKIEGAVRFGRAWMIPKDAKKPLDGRTKESREPELIPKADMPMPKKTPFLYMTNLYYASGCEEEAVANLSNNPEAQTILSAEIACAKGNIDAAYKSASSLLEKHSGFYAVLATGTLLAQCAIWKGDLDLWRKAKIHISEANAQSDTEREILTLCICAVNSMLYEIKDFPDWFKIGCFELLHKDSLPAAKVYYSNYLYAIGHALASKRFELEGVKGLSLMGLLPATIEPMISQAMADDTPIAEIHLRLTCAIAYHYSNNDKQAIRHIDKAIALALPDKLYGILAEYCRTIGKLMELRIKEADEEVWEEVSRLFRIYAENWEKLDSKITGRKIIASLSEQNREVARLAAFKLSDAEIAARTNMSISGVKQAIRIIKEKSGLEREAFAAIL